jgi:hypothetical protein
MLLEAGKVQVVMRVFLDIEDRSGELLILVTCPQLPRAERPVIWMAGKRLLVAKGSADTVADPVRLADTIEPGTGPEVDALIAKQREYGSLLFEAAFGQQIWDQLLGATSGHPYLEIAVRDVATDDQAAMQALRWEALYDGDAFVAAQGARNGTVSVSIVRLVSAPAGSGAVDGGGAFQPIDGIPTVLFAIGSRLTDPNVRPGAEFMGIMRRLERDGGMIHPKVLVEATLESLRHELLSFHPDIVHLIGHGTRDLDDNVCLGLRPESGTDDGLVTAQQLLGALRDQGYAPKVVILSACQTAASPAGAAHVNNLPFAAQLVAGGVPIVVAMAGDIEDTACRVFARALTAAIGQGVPLGKAVISGRRATFYNHAYDSADWIMPTIFLAEDVPTGVPLVNIQQAKKANDRIHDLGMHLTQETSVFCGRREFFPAMDQLLDGHIDALVASTPGEEEHYGGTRLLRELGARAVRTGVVPILLGPYDLDPPHDLRSLAEKLIRPIKETGNALGLDNTGSHVAAFAARDKPEDLAKAIRADLGEIIDALDPDDPFRSRPSPLPQAVLLCHRVDRWQFALNDLIDMLGPRGLRGAGRRVPVVMTGAKITGLANASNGLPRIPCSAVFLEFGRFSREDDEDLLAYQWWLLNPPPGTHAYAPIRKASSQWPQRLRFSLEKDPVYPGARLYTWAQMENKDFTSGDDEGLFTTYVGIVP